MKVHIPSPLHDYTKNKSEVEAEGSTLEELLEHLDKQYPGIRFRMVDEQGAIRPHMRIFVNGQSVSALSLKIKSTDDVQVLQSLSGG